MCRYALYGPYKQHFACFTCRKAFKWPRDAHRPPPPGTPGEVICPQCAGPMADMGLDFQAPKQGDVRQWHTVEVLFWRGFTFHGCGCGGPGARPRTPREVPAFLALQSPSSAGEALLRKTLERAMAPGRFRRERSLSENHREARDHWPRRSVLQKVRAR